MPTLEKGSQSPTLPLTVKRQMVGFKERLAERIVEAREQQGWDQRELAYRAQLSDKTVQRLEDAQVDKPRPSTMRKLAEALNKDVADLRPNMETEEKNLRAQLDRIEQNGNDLADRLGSIEIQLAELVAALGEREPRPKHGRSSGTSTANEN